MAIAITGLSPPSFFGFDRSHSNDSRQQVQRVRSGVNQDSNHSRQGDDARSRIIPGEVVARETERRSVDSAQRTLDQRQVLLSQPDSRQLSQRGAVQTYEQNEALITRPGEQRQVSGIIDEYV
ncbi:MAG: hypothetical protein ACN4GM_09600 [Gammaproteobacteria bacterium]